MHRIDTATAAAALPVAGAPGVAGFWTQGNPGTGVPPTAGDQDWFNMVQEELKAVLDAAAIAPVKGTYTQLRDSIEVLASLASGQLRRQLFLASQTWNTPAGTTVNTRFRFTLQGGGANGTASGSFPGGGAGATMVDIQSGFAPGSPITVTVGAVAGASSISGAGVTTATAAGASGINGGVPTGGTAGAFKITGANGGNGVQAGVNVGGQGASSPFGGGGAVLIVPTGNGGNGNSAGGFGAGGGGPSPVSGTVGAGTPGFVLAEWVQ